MSAPSGFAARRGPTCSALTAALTFALGCRHPEDSNQGAARRKGLCPLPNDAPSHPGSPAEPTLQPLLDLGPDLVDLGFDRTFRIEARSPCEDLQRGTLRYRQVAGAALAESTLSDDGLSFSARTLAFVEDSAAVPGVVPFSERTRGRAVVQADWTSDDGAVHVSREVTVASTVRSRGLGNVPVHAQVHLNGQGWKVLHAPDDARASVDGERSYSVLRPDRVGTWILEDPRGLPQTLHVGRYDQVPLDCGRSQCHTAIADKVRHSPMTTVFDRGVAGPNGTSGEGCALACHTVGEPSIDDGGFTHVQRELGMSTLPTGDLAQLPRSLRRLSGVTCLGCHGPGSLPEPANRWATLRTDVCAYCHDAPPRYGHVLAWLSSSMARADDDPRTRSEPRCARCHTTAGFLKSEEFVSSWQSSPVQAPMGITCAACHDPHGSGSPAGDAARPPHLLRLPHVPAWAHSSDAATGGTSAVCVPCHAPAPDEVLPSASAAALWAGGGGLDPRSGGPLLGTASTDACITCHRGGPVGLELGASHGFRALAADPEQHRSSRLRATEVWNHLVDRQVVRGDPPESGPRTVSTSGIGVSRSVHASIARGKSRDPVLLRAAYDILLLLEDRGAFQHNANYAKILLEAAEDAVSTPGRPSPPRREVQP